MKQKKKRRKQARFSHLFKNTTQRYKACQNILDVIDNILLKKAEDSEAKVFYAKMKGDYNRYVAEYAEGDLKKKSVKMPLLLINKPLNLLKVYPFLIPLALD